MMARLRSCTQMLKGYHAAVENKRKEILRDAKAQRQVPIEKLRKRLANIAEEGLKSYLAKHQL